jgi:ABC-2 type transport system permease protein
MYKTLVIARREFLAAVRTKAFIISLVVMPALMGGSILVQLLFKDVHDTKDSKVAVIDLTPGATLLPALKEKMDERNQKAIYDPATGKQVLPRYLLENATPDTGTTEALDALREKLSERVRKGDLIAFLVIGSEVLTPMPQDKPPVKDSQDYAIRFQTNSFAHQEFRQLADKALKEIIQSRRGEERGVKDTTRQEINQSVPVIALGLTRRTADGKLEDDSEQSQLAALFVPMALMMLMFMVVIMVANPLLQGVVEEKMQRIAEVLLGSVRPFELMMGKLLGMTAVSLTISGVYLAGGYWAARHYGYAEFLAPQLLAWFVVFQVLEGLMFGSLYIAIGAACTDMKESQNMLLPVMLVVCFPLFLLGNVIRGPNTPLVTAISFFPFATPMLMVARQSIPPGVPLWQPLLGIVLVLAATVLCVYVAGRIFRVGLLIQGKGARLSEMMRWVFKG